MDFEELVGFLFLAVGFLFSHKFLGDIFRIKFPNEFLLYLMIGAFSVPQNDTYQLNGATLSAMCTAVNFDASFDCGRTFVNDFLLKIVSKNVNRMHIKCAGLCDAQCVAWRSSRERFRVRSLVDGWFGHCSLLM